MQEKVKWETNTVAQSRKHRGKNVMKLKKCAKDLQLFEDVTVQKVLSNMIANGVVVYRKEVWWSS